MISEWYQNSSFEQEVNFFYRKRFTKPLATSHIEQICKKHVNNKTHLHNKPPKQT